MLPAKFSFASEADAILKALKKSISMIEFNAEGAILQAADGYASLLGYRPEELIGRRHQSLMRKEFAESQEYRSFWAKLNRGESEHRHQQYVSKNGQDMWLAATYVPVLISGRVKKIIETAVDITALKSRSFDSEVKLEAISKVQAIIEFTPDGQIITANDNFCKTFGYSVNEVVGRHHSMFIDKAYAGSREYQDFWIRLGRGEFIAEEFHRLGKGGKDIFLEASYNPIRDIDGKIFKIIKFATDVTGRADGVNHLATALNELSKGNLDYKITSSFIPQMDTLRIDFNKAVENLRSAMRDVGSSSTSIAGGAIEVRKSADYLAQRTEQQAANLQKTAATLDELTATVRKTADGTDQARSLFEEARRNVERSEGVVTQAVTAVGEIKRSSDQIGQIIGVIDEIAFQTNLLALNAGVEAARAGDAGRGFAVVASEVRALAQRSAEAAKEIKALIAASTVQVEQGVDFVGDAGKSIARIATQVTEINAIVNDIALSTKEQAKALQDVNAAINQMDQMTQQNAAMVEESTASTHHLAREAETMKGLLERFNVIEAGGASASAPRRTTPAQSRPKTAVALKTPSARGSNLAIEQSEDWAEF